MREVVVNRVGPAPESLNFDASAELLRPEATMNQPLLIPHVFERTGSRLADQCQNGRAALPEGLLV